MGQENDFLDYEGDNWFKRNKDKIEENKSFDPVINVLQQIPNLEIGRGVLEVGCANGWRADFIGKGMLSNCHDKLTPYGQVYGIEPSAMAIADGTAKGHRVKFYHGTACYLPNLSSRFQPMDLVIYGFCLYLCEPTDLFIIAAEGDRVLADGGHLVIHDFDPDYPHKVPYHHVNGLFSYKMNYARLWLANPAYTLVRKEVIPDGTAVWVLKKDIVAGWPEQVTP